MGRRRSTAEILLSRPVARPVAKRQDGTLYPQLMPDVPGMTLQAFWESVEAMRKQKRKKRAPRPRLLDPIQRPKPFGESGSAEPCLASRPVTRRPEP